MVRIAMAGREKHEKQREFERYPLDFLVKITGESRTGESFSDCGRMSNISGNGLCFATDHSDWYALGQILEIHVCLPGTDELHASMASDARVIWIRFPSQEKDVEEENALVGMAMDGCMAFETRSLSQSGSVA